MKFGTAARRAGVGAHFLWPLLAVAALFCGCARERVSVTVGANGTWTRKTVYTVTNLDLGPDPDKTAQVSDSFALPSGEGWKLTRQTTKDEVRVIAERTLGLDQTLENDIVVKESAKAEMPPAPKEGARLIRGDDPPKSLKTLTTNSVTVKEVSPGRYVYTETIHWTGDPPANMHQLDEKETALVRAALPKEMATEDNVKFVADAFSREFNLALVGPPSPLIHRLPVLMSAPEIFARHLSRRVGRALIASLKEKFGDRMTAEQRKSLTVRMVEGITDEIKSSGPSQAGDRQVGDNKNSSGAGIFISVKLPGQVIETNGIADPFNGDISWSFYPEAASLGDVTLTATCDTNVKTPAR